MSSIAQWQPSQQAIDSQLSLLEALSTPQLHNHSESLEALSRLVEQPEWILTISHIFAHAHTAPLPLRQLAGLLVKNEAFAHLAAMNHDCQVQVKAHMLVALAAPQPALRSTAATLVAQYSAAFPLTHWTDLLAQIGSTVGTGAAGVAAAAAAAEVEAEAALHGAMSALHRICEDSLEKLFMEGEKAMLEALLGSVLHLLGHQDPTIALLAIQTFTSTLWMLDSRGRASRVGISTFLDAFVHGIGALANDPRPSIRVEVCKAVTELMSVHYKVLGPSLDPMCTFMLAKMTDASAGVVMEACEMFRILATKERGGVASQLVCARLPTLVPTLIGLLKMTEDQYENEKALEIELAEDIASLHVSTQDAKDSSELSAQETPRKAAARLLDCLADTCPAGTVSALALPIISNLLSSPIAGGGDAAAKDPWDMERGLLALGALASNPDEGVMQSLPAIHLLVLAILQNEGTMSEVREMAAWCAARHVDWIFASCEGAFQHANIGYRDVIDNFLGPLVHALLAAMQQPHIRLQASATSALGVVFDRGGPEMTPFVAPACTTLARCQAVYGNHGYALLCDLLQSIEAACTSDDVFRTHLAPCVPHMMARVATLDATDFMVYPVFDSLIAVVPRLGSSFQPYVGALTTRACAIAHATFTALATSSTSSAVAYPDFAVKSIDVLCSILEGLSRYGALQAYRDCSLPDLLVLGVPTDRPIDAMLGLAQAALVLTSTHDSDSRDQGSGSGGLAVPTAGFGLTGDLLRLYGAAGDMAIQALVPGVVQTCLAALRANRLIPSSMALYNNVVWVLQLCFALPNALGADVGSAADATLSQLLPSMHDPRCDYTLRCNLAALLGAVVKAAPTQAAAVAVDVVVPWAGFVVEFDRDGGIGACWSDVSTERLVAVGGLVELLGLQPGLLGQKEIFEAVVGAVVAAVDLVDMEKAGAGAGAAAAAATAPGLLPLVLAMKGAAGQAMWTQVVSDLDSESRAVADSF